MFLASTQKSPEALGRLLLRAVSETGDAYQVRKLIDEGADLNIVHDTGKTALMIAAAKGNGRVCELLVEAGCDLTIVSRAGYPVHYYAANEGISDIISAALRNQGMARPLPQDTLQARSEKLLLMLEAQSADTKTMLGLIRDGVQLSLRGTTPVHKTLLGLAAETGSMDLCRELVRAGVDVGVKDARGNTADYYAPEGSAVAFYINGKIGEKQPRWVLFDAESVAEVTKNDILGIRLTNVFNMQTRQKTTITQALDSAAICHTEPQSFDEVGDVEISRAIKAAQDNDLAFDEAKIRGRVTRFAAVSRIDKNAKGA